MKNTKKEIKKLENDLYRHELRIVYMPVTDECPDKEWGYAFKEAHFSKEGEFTATNTPFLMCDSSKEIEAFPNDFMEAFSKPVLKISKERANKAAIKLLKKARGPVFRTKIPNHDKVDYRVLYIPENLQYPEDDWVFSFKAAHEDPNKGVKWYDTPILFGKTLKKLERVVEGFNSALAKPYILIKEIVND